MKKKSTELIGAFKQLDRRTTLYYEAPYHLNETVCDFLSFNCKRLNINEKARRALKNASFNTIICNSIYFVNSFCKKNSISKGGLYRDSIRLFLYTP